jgi:hypothetical protein
MVKAALPLMRGELRSDVLIYHDLPTELGVVHVVHSYARKLLLPPEYLLALEGRIPRAALLSRGSLDRGKWVSADGDESHHEEFCVFLKQIKRGKGLRARHLADEAQWTQQMGNTKIKLEWAMQIAPLGEDRLLFIFKIPYQMGLLGVSRFGVETFLEAAGWLKESLAGYDYEGRAPKRGVLQPSLALLALPELRGDADE